jgi:hypothetical protein
MAAKINMMMLVVALTLAAKTVSSELFTDESVIENFSL